MKVQPISQREAVNLVVAHHYMHRPPPIQTALGLLDDGGRTVGVVTFGIPASRHMLIGACPDQPESVIELNRLWVADDQPRNTESWFLARALALMPARIVLSYADTSAGHQGYVYRAANFFYAGWTDMERKTPRFDYVVADRAANDPTLFAIPAKRIHSRDAFRGGFAERVRRKPKVKYWTTTGNRRERIQLQRLCRWPKLDWRTNPPPIDS